MRHSVNDVCIFCSTRIQLASARSATRTQRRFLRSSNAVLKPPAAAAATAQAEPRYGPTCEDTLKQKPSFGGGWGKASFSVELTPEEAALRKNIEQSQPSPPERKSESRPLNQRSDFSRQSKSRPYGQRDPRRNLPASDLSSRPILPEWECWKCRTRNDRARANCQKCNRLRVRPETLQWRCTSCGWHNLRRGTRCAKCNSFNADDAQVGEQTKGGRYVGFRSVKSLGNATVSPGDVQSQGVRDQRVPTDKPLVRNVFEPTPNSKENERLDQRLAYSQRQKELHRKSKANDSPSYPRYAQNDIELHSPSLQPSRAPSQSFGSGWNAHSHATSTPSDVEKSQRPAQSSTSEMAPLTQNSQSIGRPSNDVAWLKSLSPDASSGSQDRFSRKDVPNPGRARRSSQPSSETVSSAISDLQNAGRRDISWYEATSTPPSDRSSDRNISWQATQHGQTAPTSATYAPDDTTHHAQQNRSPQTSESTARYTPGGSAPFTSGGAARADDVEDSRSTQITKDLSQPAQGAFAQPQSATKLSGRYITKENRSRSQDEQRGGDVGRQANHTGNAAAPYAYGRRSRKPRYTQDDYDDEAYEYNEDQEEARQRRREQRKKERAAQRRSLPPTPIYLPEFISVGNLARALRVRVEDFARKMQDLGFEETNNDHLLDAEVAGLIATEFNFEPIVDSSSENQDLQARPPAEDKSLLPPRPPVVTIMGHVDHGKTTLLDYLRKSSVAASEHGGITQHIGAFSVPMPGGRLITFLDTPGHAAFLSMRQRGANVTDIVILVVAADDSVKPQTVEAIKHAQAAKVPMIVAINKIDKDDKNIDRVKQDLARYGVEIEDFGGDTQVVCVSGKTGQGLDELEENVVALADILDMRAEVDGQAEGWVLEGATKKAGRVATVLVRRGTVRRGDIIVAGSTWAKIKSLKNEAGVQVSHAGPGTPVEVDGWKDQPTAGDEVLQATSEQQAKSAIDYRLGKAEREQMAADMSAVNESRRLEQEKREALADASIAPSRAVTDAPANDQPTGSQTSVSTTTQEPTITTLPLVLKADVSGSVEACVNAITGLGTPAISPLILRSLVGPISESDITFAASSGAQIVSFNQITTPEMSRLAEREGVKIVEENIIYRLTDLVKGRLEELLPEKVEHRVVGEAEIAKPFEIGVGGRRKMLVAGCRVRNGVISRANKAKVLRGGEGGECVFDGMLSSLKNVKKDVTEMRKGSECGMAFEGWEGFREGDMVQCYEEKRSKQTL